MTENKLSLKFFDQQKMLHGDLDLKSPNFQQNQSDCLAIRHLQ